jgi:hypothetical protein
MVKTEQRLVNIRHVKHKLTRRQFEALDTRFDDVCAAVAIETGGRPEHIAAAIRESQAKLLGQRKIRFEIQE